ncbi:MAG TPA: lactonase family protein [Planctomycetes bacterium]|nr:lactonase family protein [Fuerstiella sp.]HIK94347.1 lactonase family protein [Planctomycetota bacterium]
MMFPRSVLPVTIFACWVFLQNAAVAGNWLFVSLLQEKAIVTFERDVETGRLIRRGRTTCPAEPAILSASGNGELLFVSLRSTGQLASYRINSSTGTLKLLSTVNGGDDPAYLQTDRTGQFLFAAYYAANKVTVHRVLPDGRLSDAPLQTVPTAARAHGIAVGTKNHAVFVPHTGANRIYQFQFDPKQGRLQAAEPPYLTTPDSHHPRHLMLHPSDRWAYTSDEAGDSISVYDVDSKQATLKLKQTVSSIPADFDGSKNTTARCEITPNGRFIYVANRGHDSIAGFAIDQSSGMVRSLGQFSTEPTPRSFSISADGRYLYAAGQASGRLVVYRIGETGILEDIGRFESGPVSWSALCVDTAD